MDEHRQGVATNGARAESTSEQGWGKDRRRGQRLTFSPYTSRVPTLARRFMATTTTTCACGEEMERVRAGSYGEHPDGYWDGVKTPAGMGCPCCGAFVEDEHVEDDRV